MAAALPEYVRASVPRAGINWAGYIAWALGFVVGILNHIPGAPAGLVAANHPAPLYAFAVGFVVYRALTKAGLRPAVIPEFQSANIPARPAPVSP
jgi:purine-cytosine permease-like protein